jgi:hypothetical protein
VKGPETGTDVARARQFLKEARIVAANSLLDAAGRKAYIATFLSNYRQMKNSMFDLLIAAL